MADILQTLSIVSYILSVLFIVLAVALWFIFKITNVIGDLSGRNAKKSIAQMRQNNERTGDKSYKVSKKNLTREKLTGTMEGLGKNTMPSNIEETGLLNENFAKEFDDPATELLVESGETAALAEKVDIVNRAPASLVIRMIEEVMLIHTEEVI